MSDNRDLRPLIGKLANSVAELVREYCEQTGRPFNYAFVASVMLDGPEGEDVGDAISVITSRGFAHEDGELASVIAQGMNSLAGDVVQNVPGFAQALAKAQAAAHVPTPPPGPGGKPPRLN